MSASRPWMKFYPRDWRGDQALRAVSMAARGFWMECLCIMHEASPRGHLLLNGKKVEDDALARIVGASPAEVSAWLAELRTAGVSGVTRNGTVVSRRMIRDENAAQTGSKSSTKRWEQAAEKKRQSGDPNRSAHSPPTHLPSTQRPEARIQKDTSPSQQQPGGESEEGGGETAHATGLFDRSASDGLEARLRQAAGYEQNPAPSLFVVGPIEALVGEGFDLETEILPVIRAKAMAMAMTKPVQSWAFFVPIIREERDRRSATGGRRGDERRALDNDLERARQRIAGLRGKEAADGR